MAPSCPFHPRWTRVLTVMRNRVWIILPTVAFSVVPGPACAQAIRGFVLDDQILQRVEGVTISLISEQGGIDETLTDRVGWFFFSLPSAGSFRLQADRLGYAPTLSQWVAVELRDTLTVEFHIDPEAVLLDPLLVVAHSGAGGRFSHRMNEWGRGIFITPEMVDSIQPVHPAEVLRDQEDIFLSWGFSTECLDDLSAYCGPVPRIKSQAGTGCMQYLINGMPVRRTRRPWETGNPWKWFPLDGLRGEDIVAVEVYREIAEVPPELRKWTDRDEDLGGVGLCGLTNFWTRDVWFPEIGIRPFPVGPDDVGKEQGWFRRNRSYLVGAALAGAIAYLILSPPCFGNCGG